MLPIRQSIAIKRTTPISKSRDTSPNKKPCSSSGTKIDIANLMVDSRQDTNIHGAPVILSALSMKNKIHRRKSCTKTHLKKFLPNSKFLNSTKYIRYLLGVVNEESNTKLTNACEKLKKFLPHKQKSSSFKQVRFDQNKARDKIQEFVKNYDTKDIELKLLGTWADPEFLLKIKGSYVEYNIPSSLCIFRLGAGVLLDGKNNNFLDKLQEKMLIKVSNAYEDWKKGYKESFDSKLPQEKHNAEIFVENCEIIEDVLSKTVNK